MLSSDSDNQVGMMLVDRHHNMDVLVVLAARMPADNFHFLTIQKVMKTIKKKNDNNNKKRKRK